MSEPLFCHKCGQPPLIVPQREGLYCGRCSTGQFVTIDHDARVDPGDYPKIDAQVAAVSHLPFDEAMRALYPLPAKKLRSEQDEFFARLSCEFESAMRAVRDQIDADYLTSFQATGVDKRALRPSQGGDPGDEQAKAAMSGQIIVVPAPDNEVIPTPGVTYPTYNHTRGDSELNPCSICEGLMAAQDAEPTPRPVTVEGDVLMRKLESERDTLCKLILPPTRPCYVCTADTGVTREGVPLCVGCR